MKRMTCVTGQQLTDSRLKTGNTYLSPLASILKMRRAGPEKRTRIWTMCKRTNEVEEGTSRTCKRSR
jgi:hypothetical protein